MKATKLKLKKAKPLEKKTLTTAQLKVLNSKIDKPLNYKEKRKLFNEKLQEQVDGHDLK